MHEDGIPDAQLFWAAVDNEPDPATVTAAEKGRRCYGQLEVEDHENEYGFLVDMSAVRGLRRSERWSSLPEKALQKHLD